MPEPTIPSVLRLRVIMGHPRKLSAVPPLTKDEAPGIPLMHAIAVLNGLGTLLLGPILPLLAARWHLNDAHTGLLLLAQFCGSFLGRRQHLAPPAPRPATGPGRRHARSGRVRRCALAGHRLRGGWVLAAGFGIGRAITTVNILAGQRALTHRGAALARLNLSWSLGALLSPLLAGWLTPHFALRSLLLAFAALYLVSALTLTLESRGLPSEPAQPPAVDESHTFATTLFLYFTLLLFLYGGLETCLSGWLTTFALRFGRGSLLLSEYTTVLLLAGLTVGRAASSWLLLLRVRDHTLTQLALVASAALAVVLASVSRPGAIAAVAVLLGFTLAPVFPALFGLLLAQEPPARKAGIALAASGLGAAALPWLLGVVSTHTGSLKSALTVPVAAALAMLALISVRLSRMRNV